MAVCVSLSVGPWGNLEPSNEAPDRVERREKREEEDSSIEAEWLYICMEQEHMYIHTSAVDEEEEKLVMTTLTGSRTAIALITVGKNQ